MTKKAFSFISLLLCFCFVLTSCKEASTKTQVLSIYKNDEDFNNEVMGSDDYYVCENDTFKLGIIPADGSVNITDKRNGKVYKTNPESGANGSIEIGSNKAVIDSQVVVHFLNSLNSNQLNSWTSNEQCIEKGQYSYYKIDNGIGVNYFFGEMPEEILTPQIMSVENYEKIYNALDDAGRDMLAIYYTRLSEKMYYGDEEMLAMIREKYPIIKNQDIYTLNLSISFENLSKDIKKQIAKLLEKGGYNKEKYEQDISLFSGKNSSLEKPAFSIALEYTLTNNGFSVSVPNESISYNSDVITVTKIDILPNFEAVSINESGAFFVPDGCGALISANDNKNPNAIYTQRIYGEDELLMSTFKEDPQNSDICFPVFGLSNSDKSFFSIITDGEAQGYINATLSGTSTNYNRVYASFIPHAYYYQTSNALSGGEKYITDTASVYSDFTIDYYLYDGEKQYADFAKTYRNYLIENKLLNSSNETVSVDLEFISTVKVKKNIAGVPITLNTAATEYSWIDNTLRNLEKDGLQNIDVTLSAFCNDGNNNELMTSVDLISAAGSKKNLKSLVKNNEIFAGVNFFTAKKNYTSKKYSAHDVDGVCVQKYDFFISGKEDKYIISPKYYEKITEKFLERSNKYFDKICDLNVGRLIAADYDEDNPISRQEALKYTKKYLSALASNSISLKVSGSNAYVLSYADSLIDVPLTSANKYIFTEDVPFISMVLRGMLPFSGKPINLSDNPKIFVLKSIEMGANVRFKLIQEQNTILINSPEMLFSVNYEQWESQLKYCYEMIKRFNASVGNSMMTEHNNISDDIKVSLYDNGVQVYVNYSNESVTLENGITIPANDFYVYAS